MALHCYSVHHMHSHSSRCKSDPLSNDNGSSGLEMAGPFSFLFGLLVSCPSCFYQARLDVGGHRFDHSSIACSSAMVIR